MSTARSEWTAPSRTATHTAAPNDTRRFTSSAMTTPFSTETPARAMKPTAAGMLKENPRVTRPRMPPISANGTTRNTAKLA